MYNENELFPALLKTLSDVSDDVVHLALRLLAQISAQERPAATAPQDDYFTMTIRHLTAAFRTDRKVRIPARTRCNRWRRVSPWPPWALRRRRGVCRSCWRRAARWWCASCAQRWTRSASTARLLRCSRTKRCALRPAAASQAAGARRRAGY